MIKKNVKLGLATAGFIIAGSLASASTFAFTGVGTSVDVNFLGTTDVTADNDLGLGLGVQTVDFINGAQKTNSNGLSIVGGPTNVKFTYLGFEAGNANFSATSSLDPMFVNGTSAVGDTVTFGGLLDGLLDFSFGTTAPEAAEGEIFNNAGANPVSSDYAIGYHKVSDTAYYLFFDDIAGNDRDFDDIGVLIEIEPVPVPAGILLMGTAISGFGVMRRKAKKASA